MIESPISAILRDYSHLVGRAITIINHNNVGPVRQAELNPDTGLEDKGDNSRSVGVKSGAPEVVVSVAEGGKGLLTPKNKNSGRDIEEQQPESSLSPPKARKGST